MKTYTIFYIIIYCLISEINANESMDGLLLNIRELNETIEAAYNGKDIQAIKKLMTNDLSSDLAKDFDRKEIDNLTLSITVDGKTLNVDEGGAVSIVGSWVYNEKGAGEYLSRICIYTYRKTLKGMILTSVTDVKDAYVAKIFSIGEEVSILIKSGNYQKAKRVLKVHGADLNDIDILFNALKGGKKLKFTGVSRRSDSVKLTYSVGVGKYSIGFMERVGNTDVELSQ